MVRPWSKIISFLRQVSELKLFFGPAVRLSTNLIMFDILTYLVRWS